CGGQALVATHGPADDWMRVLRDAGAPFAWDVDASARDVTADAILVLRDSSIVPACIRLIGGGPEAAMLEGHGIGNLMGRLALAGFDGAVVLAPSADRYRVAWSTWLGRRGGWGCGSKAEDRDLVRLATAG